MNHDEIRSTIWSMWRSDPCLSTCPPRTISELLWRDRWCSVMSEMRQSAHFRWIQAVCTYKDDTLSLKHVQLSYQYLAHLHVRSRDLRNSILKIFHTSDFNGWIYKPLRYSSRTMIGFLMRGNRLYFIRDAHGHARVLWAEVVVKKKTSLNK